MKIVHLADLHLGKRVYDFSMIEDQKFILNQIFDVVVEKKADCVIIAGDVYDKSIPPVEAVELLDDFLFRLSEKKIPVLIISGNHDSPERLSFGSRLMKNGGVHFASVYDGSVKKVSFSDAFGTVDFYLLPFVKPASVRPFFPDEEINDYNDAVRFALSSVSLSKEKRNVLVAHQFVTGAQTCESEERSVGGLDNVSASLFDSFDYVALGHIHGPQKISRDSVRYSGTPLKYSFSECNHKKSVLFIELAEKGKISYEALPLKPLHDMREICGSYNEVMLKENYENTATDDYVRITLTDDDDIPEVFAKLKTVYKNLMRLDFDNARTKSYTNVSENLQSVQTSPLELFEKFYEFQNGRKLEDEQKKIITSEMEKIWESY